jgi:hypothetical protein
MTLLDEIPSDSIWKKIASGLMLIHVMLAFPVLLSPTLFELERYLLGKDADMEVLQQTIRLRSSKQLITQKPILSAQSIMQQENPFIYDTLRDESPTTTTAYYQEDSSAITIEDNVSYTMRDRFISIFLRSVILGSQVFLALMLQSSFMDLLSLIGATAVTISCMIMPCLCYLRVCPIQLDFKGRADRALCRVIIVASGLLGLYCSINAIKNISHNLSTYQLFGPAIALDDSSLERYPYCHEGERD